jgi:predicted Fe-S protein YdhL (DUF1289 family)
LISAAKMRNQECSAVQSDLNSFQENGGRDMPEPRRDSVQPCCRFLFSTGLSISLPVFWTTLARFIRVVDFGAVSLLAAWLEKQRRQEMGFLEEANRNLRSSLAEIKVLQGILPICFYCNRIRTEAVTWVQMESTFMNTVRLTSRIVCEQSGDKRTCPPERRYDFAHDFL